MSERGSLTRQQVQRALGAVRGDRIEVIKGLNYIPAEEVRAELIRQFGPGNWDSSVVALDLVFENEAKSKANAPVWDVCYRAGVLLRVRDYDGNPVAEFTEYHVGTTRHPERGEAHANAITSASSYALRRCAIGLGDNYGLHLYAKGSTDPIVRGTLLLTEHLRAVDAPKDSAPAHDPKTGEVQDDADDVAPAPDPAAQARAKDAVRGAFGG